jgi:CRISPR-associated protein Csd1
MLLTKLYEFSQRPDIKSRLPIEMYGKVRVSWLVEISLDGALLGNGFFPLGKEAEPRMVPDIVRASGIKPKLLVDNGEYVLGIGREDSDHKKVAERHRQFKALVQKCANETQAESVQAVAKFLASWNPEQDRSKLPEGFDPAQVVTFWVTLPSGQKVIPADADANLTEVQQFWARYTVGEDESGNRPIMTCLVTGDERSVEERLPVKIKGIPNGQTAGTSLVSANAAPFTSYGLQNSLTSPICREAGEGFGKALNYLISAEDSRFYLNNSVVYVFWTQQATRYKLGAAYKRNQPGKIRKIFQSALSGRRKTQLKANQFYVVGLTASGGRAVVRDWLETTLDQAMENLIVWWDAQEIVNSFGVYNEKRYFSIDNLANSLYRDPSKDAIARISVQLLQVAIKGGSLPLDILAQSVRRNRAERQVTHERAALMKLVLTTQSQYKNTMTDMQCLTTNPKFEDERDRSAYQCGRLLAQLERIQETAHRDNLKDVNATLIDRYYGAASTTPGKVFGGLVKDAQAHLSRIRKDKRGAYETLQQKLEEILCNISPESDKLPNNLTMQQQSIFALGYYHQRAQNRRDATDAKAKKAEAASSAEELMPN